MDEIDRMETLGLSVTQWAGTRFWDAADFSAMLRLRKWKDNVRKHDSKKRYLTRQRCECCGQKQKRQLNRHHPWNELKPHDRRPPGTVRVLCKQYHQEAEAT